MTLYFEQVPSLVSLPGQQEAVSTEVVTCGLGANDFKELNQWPISANYYSIIRL